MIIKNIYLIAFFLSLSYIVNSVDIKVLTNTENGGYGIYSLVADKFNKYAKEKGLDINLQVMLLSKENSTVEVTDYESTIEQMMSKKSIKYDLYYYDNIFSYKFGPHLLPLDDKLSEEHINIYIPGVAEQICYYKDQLIALPTNIDFTVLYYNNELLKQYNKSAPKTWDELIETGKYILEKEKEKDKDTTLMVYNGSVDDLESGTCSIYEFIYSCRDSVDSKFPDLKSQTTIDALRLLKKIKTEVSSDAVFKEGLTYTKMQMFNNNYLFAKFWYMPYIENYLNVAYSLLPGKKEGVSGSVIGGYNIGINKYIDEQKKEAAIEAVKFITSYELQKELVMNYGVISPITKMYEDEDVCKKANCDILKSKQLIARPANGNSNYSAWSEKFRHAIFEYLYGDKDVSTVVEDAEKMLEKYSGALNPRQSILGLLIFVLTYTVISAILSI